MKGFSGGNVVAGKNAHKRAPACLEQGNLDDTNQLVQHEYSMNVVIYVRTCECTGEHNSENCIHSVYTYIRIYSNV